MQDEVPATPEELEIVEALSLLESVQPEACDQRREMIRARRERSIKAARGLVKTENGGMSASLMNDAVC